MLKFVNSLKQRDCSFRDLNAVFSNAKSCYLDSITKNKDSKFSLEHLKKSLDEINITDGEMFK